MDGFAPDDRVDNRMAKKELAANRYQKSKAISTKSDTAASNDTQDSLIVNQMADDELDIEEVTVVLASQVTVLLQDLFGLTNDELQDILNSLDLQPESLILCDSESGIMAVNADALKQLVLGVHGVEDASAFLTNDALNTELSEVTDALTDFVCDTLGVTKEELASLKAEAMLELLKQAVDTLQAGKWNGHYERYVKPDRNSGEYHDRNSGRWQILQICKKIHSRICPCVMTVRCRRVMIHWFLPMLRWRKRLQTVFHKHLKNQVA